MPTPPTYQYQTGTAAPTGVPVLFTSDSAGQTPAAITDGSGNPINQSRWSGRLLSSDPATGAVPVVYGTSATVYVWQVAVDQVTLVQLVATVTGAPIGPSQPPVYAPLSDALEGQAAKCFGASYDGSDYNNRGPATRYPNRLARRFGYTLDNQAVSGYTMVDNAARANGTTGTPIVAPFGGLAFVSTICNDPLHYNGAVSGKLMDGFRLSLASILLNFMASAKAPATGAAFASTSGTWGNQALSGSSGGNSNGSSNAGAVKTATTPVGKNFALLVTAIDTAVFGGGIVGFTTSLDGGSAVAPPNAFGESANQCAASYLTGMATTTKPVLFTGLANQAHTIAITKDNSTNGLFLDSLLTISDNPAPIIVPLMPHLRSVGYPSGSSDATVDAFNAATLDVIAKLRALLPQALIYTVDLNAAGWNTATMIGSADNIHPNDLGEAFIADTIGKVIASLPASGGLVKL